MSPTHAATSIDPASGHAIPRMEMPMWASWKNVRYHLEELGCRLLESTIPLLPRALCLLLADTIGWLAALIDRRGRAVALGNLDCAFGSKYLPHERAAIAARSCRNFARTMLDLFWLRRLDSTNFRDWIQM